MPSLFETARGVPPAWRLMAALGLSLLLHAVLLLGLRIGQVEKPGASIQQLQVRLQETPRQVDQQAHDNHKDEQPVLLRAIDKPAPEAKKQPVEPPLPKPEPKVAEAPSSPQPEKPGMPEQAAGTTTLDIPLPEDPTYYPARQVDEHPVLVSGGRPVYPEQAGRSRVKGEVTVLMMLNEQGAADEVSIVEAKPEGKGFEEAVIVWLRDARFKPAQRKGRAVKARVVYRVTFEP